MSQSQYNSLMSSLLNQKHALTKLRAELKGKKGRICWYCKKFRHLVCNCRNKREVTKGKSTFQNKFEVIASRIIQYRVKEEIKVRRQEMAEEVKCFRCWEVGHYKWEYLNIKKRKRSREEVAYVARL